MVNGLADLPQLKANACRRVTLPVEVDEQHALAHVYQDGAQVCGGRALAGPAFVHHYCILLCHGYAVSRSKIITISCRIPVKRGTSAVATVLRTQPWLAPPFKTCSSRSGLN